MRIAPILFAKFKLDGGSMFAAIPKALWSRYHPPDEYNRIDMVCRSVLIERGDRLVLVDTGIGDRFDHKWRSIYAIEPAGDPWSGLGVDPGDVTDVVISHMHFDHAGGSTVMNGSVQVAVYPNATFHIQHDHYEWFKNPNLLDRASYRPDELLPVERAGRLNLLSGEQEILPGVRVIAVCGHVPGMQLVLIEGEGEKVLYAADLIPLASQIKLHYIMGYDLCRIMTLQEKKEMLERSSDDGWWLFLEHDPKTFFFRVGKKGEGFEIVEDRSDISGWISI